MTNDLLKRLTEHNSGYSTYTKSYKPWSIIYKESFLIRQKASDKEKYYKSASGRRWLKNNVFNKAGVAKLVDAHA